MTDYIYFGSEDSTDIDSLVVVKKPLSNKDAKEFIKSVSKDNYDINICTVKDGYVDWCYKGTPDELNNCVYITYDLHKQKVKNPVIGLVQRDIGLKAIRTIRGVLSYSSRTKLRPIIKRALKDDSLYTKTDVITAVIENYAQNSVFVDMVFNNPKATPSDVSKFLAYQMIQTLALYDGIEVFTKSGAIEYAETKLKPEYKHVVKACMDRVEFAPSHDTHFLLQCLVNKFLRITKDNIESEDTLFGKTYENLSSL